MSTPPARFRAPQRRPLALGIMALCTGSVAPLHAATTWHVNTCAEGNSGNTATKTGTLRFTLANAAVGASGNHDTIVLGLPASCHSTISLTTGALAVTQDYLDIIGPADRVTITAQGSPVKDRVVAHTGVGMLTLKNLNMQYGSATTQTAELGGCIYSKGSVTLNNAGVYACQAKGTDIATGRAYGGGVFTVKDLRLMYSTIAGNLTAAATSVSNGGGAYVRGYLYANYSTIADNRANGIYGRGGGVVVAGHGASINSTTISGNTAHRDFGGLMLRGPIAASITNSTISGNSAQQGIVGGVYATAPLTMRNSTVAFNDAAAGVDPVNYAAPGLALKAPTTAITDNLQSVLISNNTYASAGTQVANDLSLTGPVNLGSSAKNLVYAAKGVSLGGVATTGACPLLGPLRDNGGHTWTHQLLSHSPAINAGNNTSTIPLQWDQRGLPYARESAPLGTTPTADIGAYEVQQDDIIFNADFEGCP